jgi:hypothetical protein
VQKPGRGTKSHPSGDVDAIDHEKFGAWPLTNYQRVTRITREAALQEGRQEGRASLLDLISRYAPERLAELQQVDDMNVLREALDQAIQQRLSGVRQG